MSEAVVQCWIDSAPNTSALTGVLHTMLTHCLEECGRTGRNMRKFVICCIAVISCVRNLKFVSNAHTDDEADSEVLQGLKIGSVVKLQLGRTDRGGCLDCVKDLQLPSPLLGNGNQG